MSKKPTSKKTKEKRSPGRNVLLTLTLVPLILGVLLIGAWAMDYTLFEDPQSQPLVGVMFFLLSFAASNALQKRWYLAAGWGLMMCADLVLLASLNLWAQILAIVLGVVGLGFITVEFFRQYQAGNAPK